MSETKEPTEKPSKPKEKKMSAVKKLDATTLKILSGLKDRANKKVFGRKVRDGEIIACGLSKIDDTDIAKLQEMSLTEEDRLNIAFGEFVKSHGKATKGQFISHLLSVASQGGNK